MLQYSAIISSPLGKLGIITDNNYLLSIDFLPSYSPELTAKNQLAEIVCNQLHAYFSKQLYYFSLPLAEKGTAFQKLVWHNLRNIKLGHTVTYGELAKQLNTSARAIGNACRKNPIPIITPCHRIVASNHLGGYSGQTTGNIWQIKGWLLDHEAIF